MQDDGSKGARLRVEAPGEGYHRGLIACQSACPVNTDARGYVRAIAEGRFDEAYLIARGPNPFASICGRICGAPCEAACRRGRVPRMDDDGRLVGVDRPIAIRALKRFACEQAFAYRPRAEDPVDHIAVEAGFVGYLMLKESYAAAAGDVEAREVTRAARKRFVAEHLGPFAAEICRGLSGCGVPHLERAGRHLAALSAPREARRRSG